MRRRDILTGVGSLVTGANLTFPAPAIAQGTRQLKMVTDWPAGSPGLQSSAARLARRIGVASGGRINIEMFPVGALVRAFETFDAVGAGVADMYHSAGRRSMISQKKLRKAQVRSASVTPKAPYSVARTANSAAACRAVIAAIRSVEEPAAASMPANRRKELKSVMTMTLRARRLDRSAAARAAVICLQQKRHLQGGRGASANARLWVQTPKETVSQLAEWITAPLQARKSRQSLSPKELSHQNGEPDPNLCGLVRLRRLR